ncbi:hypothetical protein, partial [Nocardia neocaledoniensis]|uniref:hypothetical protein n=1 Tax=Nocardia neocaledoniensis TaxID=236511 RepID=UPI0024572F64
MATAAVAAAIALLMEISPRIPGAVGLATMVHARVPDRRDRRGRELERASAPKTLSVRRGIMRGPWNSERARMRRCRHRFSPWFF